MPFCAGKSNIGTRSGICPRRAERNLCLPSNARRASKLASRSPGRSSVSLRASLSSPSRVSLQRIRGSGSSAHATKRMVQKDRPFLHSFTDEKCGDHRAEPRCPRRSHSGSSHSHLFKLPFIVNIHSHCLSSLGGVPLPDTFEDGSMLHQRSLLITSSRQRGSHERA